MFLDYQNLIMEDRVRFYHRNVAGVDFNGADRKLWHSWTGFLIPLQNQFSASLEYEIDYDNSPYREKHNHSTLRLKMGKEW